MFLLGEKEKYNSSSVIAKMLIVLLKYIERDISLPYDVSGDRGKAGVDGTASFPFFVGEKIPPSISSW